MASESKPLISKAPLAVIGALTFGIAVFASSFAISANYAAPAVSVKSSLYPSALQRPVSIRAIQALPDSPLIVEFQPVQEEIVQEGPSLRAWAASASVVGALTGFVLAKFANKKSGSLKHSNISPPDESCSSGPISMAATYSVKLQMPTSEATIQVKEGQYILDAALDAGLEIPSRQWQNDLHHKFWITEQI